MDSKLTLAQRLNKIMQDVGYIKKRPKAGLPYPYVAHDDVSEALRASFIKHGVLCLPSVVEERQEGNRCVLKGLMHEGPDEVQIAVWKELNTNAKKTAKQLLAELPA